jgi:hypothetical protein
LAFGSVPDPLQVGNGGTGLTALTANFIPFGNSATQLGSTSTFNWKTNTTGISGFSGNSLGVGIASQVATLHVRGGNSNNAIIDNNGSQFTTMSWYNNGSLRAQGYYDASNLLFVFGTDVAAPLVFKANGTEVMRLSSGGGVSIGTATGAGANNLLVNGTVTGSSFSGAGTGLTGTAAGLSIGGNAANVTGTVAVANGGTGITSAGTAGNVLTSNGTAWASTTPAPAYVGIRSQRFTSSGTFTVPTGITSVKVTVTGGGGGGASGGGVGIDARGGGGGGTAVGYLTGLTPGGSVSFTIGGGGTQALTNGNPGGNSSCSGFVGNGGPGGSNGGAEVTGGGGTSSNGMVHNGFTSGDPVPQGGRSFFGNGFGLGGTGSDFTGTNGTAGAILFEY